MFSKFFKFTEIDKFLLIAILLVFLLLLPNIVFIRHNLGYSETEGKLDETMSIKRFDVYEHSLHSNKKYDNPFIDVSLQVHIENDYGDKYTINGFYDGDKTWKFRFMPRIYTTYYYTTFSNDNELNGKSGSFKCVKSKIKGSIRIHKDNPFALMHEDGTPFLWTGDTEWRFFTDDIPFSVKKDAIDFLSENGVNNLLITLANLDGELNISWPWEGSKQNMDHSRFDLKKLKKWDEIINYMKNKGIIADLFFYSDDSKDYLPKAFSFEEILYFQYMIARYSAYWNICWTLALEYQEYRSAKWVKWMAQFVKTQDIYDKLLAVHQLPGSKYEFAGFKYLDRTSLQALETNAKKFNETIIFNRDYTKKKGKAIPILNEEFYLSGTVPNTLTAARQGAWAQICASAAGYKLGSLRIYELGSKWKEQPHFEITKILNKFVTNYVHFWDLQPENYRVKYGNYCAKGGNDELPQFLVYSIRGGQIPFHFGDLKGSFEIIWLNPISGNIIKCNEIIKEKTFEFNSPFGENEVVFVINPIV